MSVEPDRHHLERLISSVLRDLTFQSGWIARTFADQNNLSANEFRALLFVMISETAGVRMTAGDLCKQMGLTGAAITYLVERMTETGHLRRETDPADKRKVILRYGEHGMEIARAFFTGLGQHNHDAMADLPDSDLEAAQRTLTAMVGAMTGFRADLVSRAKSEPPC
jgi:DNA-binding MarR family transcriptional regulator